MKIHVSDTQRVRLIHLCGGDTGWCYDYCGHLFISFVVLDLVPSAKHWAGKNVAE